MTLIAKSDWLRTANWIPTTFSTAFPARATITRPVNACEICNIEIAGVKADTNQSETNAEPTPAITRITIANQIGQGLTKFVSSSGSFSGPPWREKGMLAINTIRRITAQAILNPSSCPAAGVCSPAVSVGIIIAATASKVRLAIIRGACAGKCWVPCRRPPAKNASPSTNRLFPRIEPTIAACTTSINPARKAKIPTKSSGKLPSADCNTPVAPEPRRSPTCSVAWPTSAARSASAPADTAKMRTALAWNNTSKPANRLRMSDPAIINQPLRLKGICTSANALRDT